MGSSRSAGSCRSPRRPIVSMRRGGVIRPDARTRASRDDVLKVEMRRVFEANYCVYGVHKVWRQMQRHGVDIACCKVGRLMRRVGLEGAFRGKPLKTTISDRCALCSLDRVNRQLQASAPNALWVSDFTHVAT